MSCDFIFTYDAKFLIKYIFTFHIIKNNYFFLSPDSNLHFASIPIRFLHHLNWDWDGSQPDDANRQTSRPDQVIPLSSPLPSHCPPQPSPTSPYGRSTRAHIEFPPDSIPHQGVSPPYSRLWRSLTGIITRNTSNYTRNTYI